MSKPTPFATDNKHVMLLISALGVSTVAWLASRYLFGSSTKPTPPPTPPMQKQEEENTMNFVQIMKQQVKKWIYIFIYNASLLIYHVCICRIVKWLSFMDHKRVLLKTMLNALARNARSDSMYLPLCWISRTVT